MFLPSEWYNGCIHTCVASNYPASVVVARATCSDPWFQSMFLTHLGWPKMHREAEQFLQHNLLVAMWTLSKQGSWEFNQWYGVYAAESTLKYGGSNCGKNQRLLDDYSLWCPLWLLWMIFWTESKEKDSLHLLKVDFVAAGSWAKQFEASNKLGEVWGVSITTRNEHAEGWKPFTVQPAFLWGCKHLVHLDV